MIKTARFGILIMNSDLLLEVEMHMTTRETQQNRTTILTAAGLSVDAATEWSGAAPDETTTFSLDRHAYSDFWLKSARLMARLPAAAHRSEPEHAAAAVILETARKA